jgi:K+ potassium transporter
MTLIPSPDSIDPVVPKTSPALALTGLTALGVVFGDIGTSPLYTLKTAFSFLDGDATPDRILGFLSLVIWTLFLITSVKYVAVAMSSDNDGEGGILALMSLLGRATASASGYCGGWAPWRGADLRRRRYHACDIRAFRARRSRHRCSNASALRGTGRGRHSGGTVRGPAARYLSHWRCIRAHYARLVRRNGGARAIRLKQV